MFGWPKASGLEAVRFCQEHPGAAWDILTYCICGAAGQNFMFLTISRIGSLANTTITTIRKFASIVVSSLLSGNPLSAKQMAKRDYGLDWPLLSDLSQMEEASGQERKHA